MASTRKAKAKKKTAPRRMRIHVYGAGLAGSATSLVRIGNVKTGTCFHVALYPEHPEQIEVFLGGYSEWKVMDLED